MKKYYLFFLLLIIISCSRGTVKNTSLLQTSKKESGKYDYILTEALRQKYVGQISDAVGLFEKCIEIDPGRSVPFFELAQIYSSMGMGQKALSNAISAASIESDNYWYQMACGSLYLQYNERDSALMYFKKALLIKPDDIDIYAALARIYSDLGDLSEADSYYQKLDYNGALNDDMFLRMIYGLIKEKNFKEAAKRTKNRIELNPSVIEYKAVLAEIYIKNNEKEKGDSIYSQIIKSSPDNPETQIVVLNNLVTNKEYESAETFLISIFKSEDINRNRKVALTRQILEDSIFIKERYYAIDSCLLILENFYSEDEEILSFRPNLYEKAGKKKMAIELYEEILKSNKAGNYFKEKLLLLYAEEEQYERLFTLASAYSKENNRSILAKVYYGISAMELKKYLIAEDELKKALILAGNEDDVRIQILSMLGEVKYRIKDTEGSFKYFDEALSIDPENVIILNNYAYYLAETDSELEKALKMAETVMENEGDNPTYIDTYAWVLYKLKRYREAYKQMEMVFKRSSERDPEVLEHMGYICYQMKDCNNAVAYWNEALEKDPGKTYLIEEIKKCGVLKK